MNQAFEQIAAFLSMRIELKNKGLPLCDCAVTADIGRLARHHRAVEFCPRATAGFAHD
jgi:hypothetical protein